MPEKSTEVKKRGRYNVQGGKGRRKVGTKLDVLTGKPYVSKAAKPKL